MESVLPGTSTVNIYTIEGELMMTLQLETGASQIDISDLTKGIYLLKISGDSSNSITTLIKE